MNINSACQMHNQKFEGLRITNKAQKIGYEFILNDKKALEKLSKTCNIKISEGSEYTGYFNQACLKVKVTPLKRSLNPFVRLFDLDAETGKFETELRNIRFVHSSLIELAKELAEKVGAKH